MPNRNEYRCLGVSPFLFRTNSVCQDAFIAWGIIELFYALTALDRRRSVVKCVQTGIIKIYSLTDGRTKKVQFLPFWNPKNIHVDNNIISLPNLRYYNVKSQKMVRSFL